MFVCVEHRLLSRRLAAPSLSFHAPSCGNIICWIRTVDLFLLCPLFISSLSSLFMAFNLSAPPPSPPVSPVYLVSLAVVWLTTHKVVSGEVGNQTQLIWDLHRVTVVSSWTNTLIIAHWLENTPVFYCFNFPPLVPSLPPLTSYAIWSVDQYLNRLLYSIVSIIDEPLPALIFLESEPYVDSCTLMIGHRLNVCKHKKGRIFENLQDLLYVSSAVIYSWWIFTVCSSQGKFVWKGSRWRSERCRAGWCERKTLVQWHNPTDEDCPSLVAFCCWLH